MRRRTGSAEADAQDGWTYSETIDEGRSAIRACGRVDGLGVDLVRSTIEELNRRGRTDITVTIERPSSVDPCARAVLIQVAEELASRHGRLTVRWAGDMDGTHADDPDERNTSLLLLGGSGPHDIAPPPPSEKHASSRRMRHG
jgi:hypothetical protein